MALNTVHSGKYKSDNFSLTHSLAKEKTLPSLRARISLSLSILSKESRSKLHSLVSRAKDSDEGISRGKESPQFCSQLISRARYYRTVNQNVQLINIIKYRQTVHREIIMCRIFIRGQNYQYDYDYMNIPYVISFYYPSRCCPASVTGCSRKRENFASTRTADTVMGERRRFSRACSADRNAIDLVIIA